MHISSVSVTDRLIWIVSLPPEDQGGTRRIQEDLEPYFAGIKLPFEFFTPQSEQHLLGFLALLERQACSGARPIIHIDAHGQKGRGLQIAASGKFVTWQVLNKAFQALNVATQNNLCIVSAVCYSLRVINNLKITEPCPFLALIAPEEEVSFGILEDKLCGFYEGLFSGLDITAAFETHLNGVMKMMHSEKIFLLCLGRYVRNYCTGKGGELRRENLLTETLKAGAINNRSNKRALRKGIKTQTKPSQALVDEYARIFLIRRAVNFTMADIEKLARPR